MKQLIEDIKLNRISYFLEIIQKKDLKQKNKAYNKISKMKITKNIGLFLLESIMNNFGNEKENEEIRSLLVSLCLKNYYIEYNAVIEKIFKNLPVNTQDRIVFLLAGLEDKSALDLYVDLILKYYKDRDFIPVANLFEKPELYSYLFPKFYKALKFKSVKNNVLILLNDYLNQGVVKDIDLKKNKKNISNSITKIFNEALKYKFSNTTKGLQNNEYLDLRFFLEISVNIESYVSTRTTQKLLSQLFDKNDNQLCLFILENYLKKGKKIDKINLEKIAKDDASRYPLYDLLDYYNLTKLFPKKYSDKKLLAKSDFYINFMINTGYKRPVTNLKFLKKITIEDYEYYVFKFKYTIDYKLNVNDYITNYLIQSSGLDKYDKTKITNEFIGISGGYNIGKNPSKVINISDRLLYSKIEKDDNIDDIVNKLLNIDNDSKDNKNLDIKQIDNESKKKEKRKSRPYFSYLLIFLFFVFIILLVLCVVYFYDPDSMVIKHTQYKISALDSKYEFKEIDGTEVYNQGEDVYYVLFYKKGNNNKNSYYPFINEYLKNNYKIYYVNLSDRKNEFLKHKNQFDFIISGDNFMKVSSKDFEYYVEGKSNILKEMKAQVIEFKKK